MVGVIQCWIEEMGNKMAKLEEKEDRISELPDHIIHHILSFFPSTKQAIQTSVLSKRWRNQWTGVPVLILDSDGMSYENFAAFVDNTLILCGCSKIKKLHLKYNYPDRKILIPRRTYNHEYVFPESVFNNASLVQLTTINCTLMPRGKVNWGCLTSLDISSVQLVDQAMKYILSGSPLLKSLKLRSCWKLTKLSITSKYLEILDLRSLYGMFYLKISCPTLQILNLISITSQVKTVQLLNLPSSLVGSIDFQHLCRKKRGDESFTETRISFARGIVQQLQHIKHLKLFGDSLLEILSAIEMRGWTCPVMNVKRLTMDCSLSSHKLCAGLACLLRNSPLLENLVIPLSTYIFDRVNDGSGERFWNSNTFVSDCLPSHLKTIEIICVGWLKDNNYNFILNFVRFLLKNARVLESMIVKLILPKDGDTAFLLEVSQALSSLPRCSQRATVEVATFSNALLVNLLDCANKV